MSPTLTFAKIGRLRVPLPSPLSVGANRLSVACWFRCGRGKTGLQPLAGRRSSVPSSVTLEAQVREHRLVDLIWPRGLTELQTAADLPTLSPRTPQRCPPLRNRPPQRKFFTVIRFVSLYPAYVCDLYQPIVNIIPSHLFFYVYKEPGRFTR